MTTAKDRPSMKIFLSYAREQGQAASEINAALAVRDFHVFFDRSSLPAGKEADVSIEQSIRKSDLFLFLISPHSSESGSYARTELEFAKHKWRNPSGRILPVMVEPTIISVVDPYLRAVTILYPQGNLAAEVASRAAALLRMPESGSTVEEFSEALQTERMVSYRPLWQLTSLLPKWPRSTDVKYNDFQVLSSGLRDWYFKDGGGMFLSRNAMTAYAALQDSLTAIVERNPAENISDEHYSAVRELLSSLRSALARDIGARI